MRLRPETFDFKKEEMKQRGEEVTDEDFDQATKEAEEALRKYYEEQAREKSEKASEPEESSPA